MRKNKNFKLTTDKTPCTFFGKYQLESNTLCFFMFTWLFMTFTYIQGENAKVFQTVILLGEERRCGLLLILYSQIRRGLRISLWMLTSFSSFHSLLMSNEGDSIKQWFSTGINFLPRRTFGNVCSHFWLSQLQGRGELSWHLVDRGQGCCSHATLHRTPPYSKELLGPKQ